MLAATRDLIRARVQAGEQFLPVLRAAQQTVRLLHGSDIYAPTRIEQILRRVQDQIRELTADVQLLLGENQSWDVMDTAPRDGTPILAHVPTCVDEDFNPLGVIECCWDDGADGWMGAVWNGCQDCWDTKVVTPVLWTPQPIPPVQAGT